MSRACLVLSELRRIVDDLNFGAHGMHVRIGDQRAAYFWSDDVPRDVHSVAKGVCVIAAGIAADDGLFDIDAPVAHYLPAATLGEGVSEVTVRHLLSMTSGIDFPWTPTLMTDWPDLALEFLSRPSWGRVFQYSNASTYTAMRALGSVVGDVSTWLEPRVFAPLGISAPAWERCAQGYIVAGGGLHLRLEEVAAIGELIHGEGVWRGRRIVSAQRVQEMYSGWNEHDAAPAYRRTALAGWGGPGRAWRLHGAYGQLLIFLDDAVVAIAADDHAGADRMAERVVETLEASGASEAPFPSVKKTRVPHR